MGNSNLVLLGEHSGGAQRTRPVQDRAILRLAHATIGLSQVAPRLSGLATARQEESEQQADRAKDVAALAQQMSTALGQTVGMLRDASREIAELTGLIRRVADQTSLIATNTGIAAARAGAEGRVFSVLAQEIRMLSQSTSDAALDVESRIRRLQESADRTASVVGLGEAGRSAARADDGPGLAWLLARMVEAQESAVRQASEAHELTALGLQLRRLSEDMIHSVGAFRLAAHRRAEAVLEELRASPGLCSHDLHRQTQALRLAVGECPFAEIAYATNMRGIQFTENIARTSFSAAYGESGSGKDWSRRPWFRGALRTPGVFSSDIYRSAATGEFCLTVSATFGQSGGVPLGVVAMDVNFRQLLGDEHVE